jgi:outer membrane protein assembly factor BamB
MSIDVNEASPQSANVPPPQLRARPPRLWISALPVAMYWGYLFLSDWMELSTFARFASRLLAGVLLVIFAVAWWWLNRRTSLADRLFGFAVVVSGGIVAAPLAHPSTGMAGFGILTGPLSVVVSVWILWVLLARRASPTVQRVGLFLTVSCAWTLLALVRLNGLSGDLRPEFHWRWNPSAEEAFLAERGGDVAESETGARDISAIRLTAKKGDWPAYRGPNRDGAVRGVSIRSDWKAHPPEEIWRRRVGPAWSSVIVVNGRLFTQEQRKDFESVVCYDAATGAEIWTHGDPVRFTEETAGPGPGATPCFADGRVYSVGCTGIVNCLDAATGKALWSHDLKSESGAELPHWGFTGSPLVVGDVVVVFAGGRSARNLFAYDCRTGDLAWAAAAGETSYSSPQPATLGGEQQVLMLTNAGVVGVDAKSGNMLWQFEIPIPPSAPRSIQPSVVSDKNVLVASEGDLGLAMLDLEPAGSAWTATQRWVSKALKPAFNDFVVCDGRAYGFDGRIFACVDLATGRRLWKGERYGEGQELLIADQSLLLVVSETGDAILLRANPERSEEIGHIKALHGRTWNHPAIVDGKLYLRNAEEMVCYSIAPREKP